MGGNLQQKNMPELAAIVTGELIQENWNFYLISFLSCSSFFNAAWDYLSSTCCSFFSAYSTEIRAFFIFSKVFTIYDQKKLKFIILDTNQKKPQQLFALFIVHYFRQSTKQPKHHKCCINSKYYFLFIDLSINNHFRPSVTKKPMNSSVFSVGCDKGLVWLENKLRKWSGSVNNLWLIVGV